MLSYKLAEQSKSFSNFEFFGGNMIEAAYCAQITKVASKMTQFTLINGPICRPSLTLFKSVWPLEKNVAHPYPGTH